MIQIKRMEVVSKSKTKVEFKVYIEHLNCPAEGYVRVIDNFGVKETQVTDMVYKSRNKRGEDVMIWRGFNDGEYVTTSDRQWEYIERRAEKMVERGEDLFSSEKYDDIV